MSEETTGGEQVAVKRRSGGIRFVVIILIIVVIALLGFYFMKQADGAVAIVNSEKITQGEYDLRYAQLAASIVSQGRSATTTEMQTAIKQQVVDTLISETLILQAARKEGIKQNNEEIDALFSQNKTQFGDTAAFEKALKDQGFSQKTFKDALVRNNIVQQYLSKHVDLTSAKATDAEIRSFYDQAALESSNVPPLSEVRTQVENQIIQQKQQLLISNYVNLLRASSTIETLIK
ncbi:MAG: hypothetical protein A2664_02890 [Candidatus Taylorbacteria bacterium RIFCSPHIGHO2_01_FULL_46_22b]|uniref:SurA N-terminal domain-containing protein n=1 Tax=Candidatus Taylorbacteria bacterium RIFCSPHIGHO2_01_FULL_46_22b TaxID=1802301 RepID=A0A1G2M621_9BACT|nr:MAG: hypothetical protein A2664_02890 [Candidatus Taylorbacteria bacterium RIFCSPHIGHO2_01_FULL_46_22b]